MENKKKNITFMLIGVLLYQLQLAGDSLPKTNIQQSGNFTNEDKISISNFLYKDLENNIYLKVKNRQLFHPSQFGKPRTDSIFISETYFDTGFIPLKNLVDRLTFKMINSFGTYFIDSKYIYIYKTIPHTPQFFTLPRSKEKFYGTKKDFLLYDTTLYFYGNIVKDVNFRNLKILSFPKRTGNGYIEFLTDGKSVFFSEYKLDKERINDFTDLRDEDKLKIIKQYSLE